MDVIARIKVVLTAAVTWLTLATLVLVQIASGLPEPYAQWIGRAVAFGAGVVLIIRRVTPVLDKANRGLLPPVPKG